MTFFLLYFYQLMNLLHNYQNMLNYFRKIYYVIEKIFHKFYEITIFYCINSNIYEYIKLNFIYLNEHEKIYLADYQATKFLYWKILIKLKR